jgi:hypothetical protein
MLGAATLDALGVGDQCASHATHHQQGHWHSSVQHHLPCLCMDQEACEQAAYAVIGAVCTGCKRSHHARHIATDVHMVYINNT